MRRAVGATGVLAALVAATLSTSGVGAAGAAEVPAQPELVTQGEEVYARCASCHSLTENRTGPRHCGLLDRKAGTQPDYEYSKAMQRSGLVWDQPTLDRFLKAPLDVVSGSKMTYAGIPDAGERAALLAYLEVASTSEACATLDTETTP